MICTKVRDGDKRIVQIKEGKPEGRHVVIVDDLVQSGGTLIECHAVLAKAGAKHGVCVGGVWGVGCGCVRACMRACVPVCECVCVCACDGCARTCRVQCQQNWVWSVVWANVNVPEAWPEWAGRSTEQMPREQCPPPHAAVSAYVTHGVFPKFSWQKFKADAGGGWVGA